MTILQEIQSDKKDIFYGINAAGLAQKFSLYRSKNSKRWIMRFRVVDYAPNGRFHNEWSGPLCSGTNKKALIELADMVISKTVSIERFKPFKKVLLEIKKEKMEI